MDLKDVLSFSGAFYKKYKDESEQLPYHINIIDELRANENAHSRILIKLLKFNKNKIDYPILKSFLEFLSSQSDCFRFDTSKIEFPRMTSEKHRIDALVVEKGKYGIIIENKIHCAEDRDKQINNYVNKVAKQELKEHQIYVIYLTKDGGRPNQKSFSKKQIQEYSEGKRYIEASYYKHVLPWLESKEILSLCNNERMLRSSIEQYTDHLKGMFNRRKEKRDMDKKLINEIECKLDISNNSYSEKVKTLQATLSDLDDCVKENRFAMDAREEIDRTRDYVKRALYESYFKLWQENIKADYSNNEHYDKVKGTNYPKTGIKLAFKGIEFGVFIEYNTFSNKVYYGINGFEFGGKKKGLNVLIDKLKLEFKLDRKSDKWYCYRDSEPGKLYKRYQRLLEEVCKYIQDKSDGSVSKSL